MAQKPFPLASHSLESIHFVLREVRDASDSNLAEIAAVARMALLWLESPHQCAQPEEVVKQALNLIWGKAGCLEDAIGYHLEKIGIFTEGDAA